MKKLIINITSFLILIILFNSCNKIDDYYLDPDATTEGDMGKLFTYMLYNDYVRPTYWDFATFETGVTAKYSQFIGIFVGSGMYQPSLSYNHDRWKAYYAAGIMNQYREIIKTYEGLSDVQKEEQYVYMQIAKVILYDQTIELVDYWGDIPFTEAGILNYTNALGYPAFDDASGIYDYIINDLDELNTWFTNVNLSNTIQTSLATQDILLGGNMELWRKYANSLRLRMLMRISFVEESTAQSEITAMLNNPDTYPLIDDNTENILLEMNTSGTSFTSEGLRAGLTDAATSNGAIAPYYMLNEVMLANNDPRVPVYWDPGSDSATWANQTYLGLEYDLTSSTASTMFQQGMFATYDSATFILNWNCPGVLITAAEVNFLKAEAYERWSFGDAQTAYEDGIRQSIKFYYGLNQSAYLNPNTSFTRDPLEMPDSLTIENYIAETAIAYTGNSEEKLQKIWTQKWLDFFILRAGEAWAEVRRTGYPELSFAQDPTFGYLPPDRLFYPDEEKSYNAANYSAVSSKDTRDTKIFWAK